MTSQLPELDKDLARLVGASGVEIIEILRCTDKSLLALGMHAGQQVVVKLLMGDDEFWRTKLAHEIAIYEAFAECPPPITVPRLLHSDHDRLLVVESVDGRPLDAHRYPDRPLQPDELEAVLDAINAFNAWHPPLTNNFIEVFDYPERVARYRAKGFLDDTDEAALSRLLHMTAGQREMNHGDPLPSNLLLTADRGCVPVDWEFTGWFRPGFDLAFLHAVLANTPPAQARIDQQVAAKGIEAAFVLNQVVVLTRELRIHQELPPSELRVGRLAIIEAQWHLARRQLHAIAASDG